MTRHFPPPDPIVVTHHMMVIEAARCWRNAKDRGQSIQPCLYRILVPYDCVMLAPVFDSLMTLCESALSRRITIGEALSLSDDEQMLIALLDGSKLCDTSINCAKDAATIFNCAICSTRIMMSLAWGPCRWPVRASIGCRA